MQVHRVQGMTLRTDVHLLLNAEVHIATLPLRCTIKANRRTQPCLLASMSPTIRVKRAHMPRRAYVPKRRALAQIFAAGQAYVALSRVKFIEQLHLWTLNMDAFIAAPAVLRAYDGLRIPERALTQAYIDEYAPTRQRVRDLLPLAGGGETV